MNTTTETPTLNTYEVKFRGRRKGAIGKFYTIMAQRFATTPEQAIENLYDDWEHVQQPEVKRIESPFDAEFLTRIVLNEASAHDSIQRHACAIVNEVRRLADKSAKANADWHDDPEAADHWLFHAPSEAQFPGSLVMETAAECFLYFLRETPAGREIFDKLCLPEAKEVQS